MCIQAQNVIAHPLACTTLQACCAISRGCWPSGRRHLVAAILVQAQITPDLLYELVQHMLLSRVAHSKFAIVLQ